MFSPAYCAWLAQVEYAVTSSACCALWVYSTVHQVYVLLAQMLALIPAYTGALLVVVGNAPWVAPMPQYPSPGGVAAFSCPKPTETDLTTHIPVSSWAIPTRGISATYRLSGANNTDLVIPDAPLGTQYASDANPTDTTGAVLNVGHVNYTQAPTKLSPYGLLHTVQACDLIIYADPDGTHTYWQVQSVAAEPQEKVAHDTRYFRTTGEHTLYLMTCAGSYVGAAGENQLSLGYTHNLVVAATRIA